MSTSIADLRFLEQETRDRLAQRRAAQLRGLKVNPLMIAYDRELLKDLQAAIAEQEARMVTAR